MKYILFLAMILSFASCSTSPTVSSHSSASKGLRGPASVGKQYVEKLWGKKITHNEADFLERVENSPAQRY